MKKLSLLVLSLVLCILVNAQDNGVGLVLTSTATKNIKLRYERKLSEKMSIGTHIGFQIPSNITGLNDPDMEVDAKYGGFNISPEFRFYPKGEALKGFYVGGYLRYANRKMSIIDESDFYTQEATGKLTTIGGGFQMGKQWIIADVVSIDFYWLGLGVCRHNISLEYETEDPSVNYESWKVDVDNEWEDVPVIGDKLETEATSNSLKMDLPFLFPDFRFGLSVSYMF